MAQLLRYARKKAAGLGESLYEGNIAVNPYEYKTRTSCDWCPYQAVCQFDETLGDRTRQAYQRPASEIWEAMEQSGKEET